MVPGGVGGPARIIRTRAVLLPRRSGPTRRRATEQLAGDLRRVGVDPRRRARRLARPVVPRRVHAGPARPELEPPRRGRLLRPRPPVLVRPRRRRVPRRLRHRGRQDARTPRQRVAAGRGASRVGSVERALHVAARGPCGVASLAPTGRRLRGRSSGTAARARRRGVHAAPTRHPAPVRQRGGVPPGVRLRLDAGAVERGEVSGCGPLDGGGHDAGRPAAGVDAQQPRRPACRHPIRARRRGDARRRHRRRARRTRTVPVDIDVGTRRARAAALFALGLPGCVYLYAGEELGLPEVLDLPDEARQDPIFARTGGAEIGRDGCRVPLPWTDDAGTSFGFSPHGKDAIRGSRNRRSGRAGTWRASRPIRARCSRSTDARSPFAGRRRTSRPPASSCCSPTTRTSWCTDAATSSSSSTCPTTSASCRPTSSLVFACSCRSGRADRTADSDDSVPPDAAVWLGR